MGVLLVRNFRFHPAVVLERGDKEKRVHLMLDFGLPPSHYVPLRGVPRMFYLGSTHVGGMAYPMKTNEVAYPIAIGLFGTWTVAFY